ncbi:MAG: hypothetical protein WAS21_03925 [Geminicoccaceae bacterium]
MVDASIVRRDELVTTDIQARDGAHHGLAVVPRTTGAAGEGADRAAELGRALLALAHEQTRHQVEVLRALAEAVDWDRATKAVNWDQVLRRQGEILERSQARRAQLHRRHVELTQAVLTTVAATRRTGRAA